LDENETKALGSHLIAAFLRGLLDLGVIDTACIQHKASTETTQAIKAFVNQEIERYTENSIVFRGD
jgi:hypothetical protein